MNTGLMDASNLGWKLAAVLNGAGDERLLASYEPERIAFARTLVKTTDRIFELAIARSPVSRVLRNLFVPSLIQTTSRWKQTRRWMFRTVSQKRIDYCQSALSLGTNGRLKAGQRLPWITWGDQQTNYTALQQLKSIDDIKQMSK